MILNLSSNDKIKTTKTISIDVQISKLFLSILGGSNFQFSYQQQFNLASKFRDYETQDQSDKGVTYSWDCKSLSSVDGICYNYKGDLLSIQQGISTVTLPERELKPYTAIVLTIQAQKEKRSTTFFATCLFTEFDIPALTVLQPLDQQNNKLNLNQDLYFTLQYNQAISSDTLSYAGALLYENRVVGTIKFDYYQVKFRIWNYYKDVNLASPMIQVRFSAYNPAYVMPSLSTINLSINIPPQNCIISVSPSSGEALKTIFTISYNSCTDEDLPLTYQFFYYNSDEDYQFEKNSPWNITRRQVADQTTNFMMSAILPQGSLVIMSQAMDSQLGISNKTQSVQVYGQNKTEEDYYQMVSQLIDYSQQNVKYENDQLVTLSIIGEDLTKNSQFQSQQINSLKGKLVTDLNAMSLQLPKFSLLSTFVNKVVAQLQQSLINSTQTQKSSIYNQLSYILKNVELSKANNNQTTLQQNNDILLQNLIDSFKILNSTVKQGSDQIDYQYYNNISLKIGNMLSNSTLPNEGSLLLQGNLSSLLSDTITQKNIYKYAIPLNQNEASNSTNILNIVSNTFEKNIYEETETFQNYVKQYENVTKNFEYSKNKLISMQINSSESNSSNISVIKYNFVNPIVSNKYNMTCLQQSEAEWSSKDCGILQVSNSQMCFCKAQKPTTIIESLDDMFLKNKNIDTVLSGQGLENISNFKDFYKYAIFWTLIAFTILEFILYLAGRSLDFKTRGRTSIQVFPQEQLNEQQIQNEQKQEYNNQLIAQPNLQLQNMENVIEQSPQSMPIQQEQQIESKRTVNLETEKQKSSLVSLKINPLSSNRIKRFRLRDKQNELKSLNCLSQNQLGDNSLKQSQQQDQIQTITTSSQDQMKDGQDSQDSQTQGNKDAIFNKLPYIKKIAIFHSFFSIFYLYDELISRPTKFTLFYIKCIHTIAISTLFSEYKNTVQLIAVALVNSIVMGVGSFLIQFTYKKGKIGKIISVFFQMVLSLIYLYIILAVSSGKSVGESNKFMLSFILSFFIDLVFVQVSTSNLMILLTKKHSYQTKYCFAKIYDILEIRQTIDALDA